MGRRPAGVTAAEPPGKARAEIEVVPATPDRWDDVVTILGGNGDKGCWCQAPRGLAVGYGKSQAGRPPRARSGMQLDDEAAGRDARLRRRRGRRLVRVRAAAAAAAARTVQDDPEGRRRARLVDPLLQRPRRLPAARRRGRAARRRRRLRPPVRARRASRRIRSIPRAAGSTPASATSASPRCSRRPGFRRDRRDGGPQRPPAADPDAPDVLTAHVGGRGNRRSSFRFDVPGVAPRRDQREQGTETPPRPPDPRISRTGREDTDEQSPAWRPTPHRRSRHRSLRSSRARS